MTKLTFAEMPRIAQISVGLTWLAVWVLFEELVVDREGLWRYMPFYKVGDYCVWDLSATIVICTTLFLLDRRGRRRP
ncbi:MAG TPA: hypothetical protein VGT99_08625 [Gammaproteobacteria bacterium]|nr:hypothetical protein [Gammaproteobacteria bacterium]